VDGAHWRRAAGRQWGSGLGRAPLLCCAAMRRPQAARAAAPPAAAPPPTRTRSTPRPRRPQVIFQHYARDLDAVQGIYEANKHKPPLPRNAPPIVSVPARPPPSPATRRQRGLAGCGRRNAPAARG
jgi:hypothetical protein